MAEKIVIGMSGGVDSSVAAMLLRDAGYDVVGVTLLLTPEGVANGTDDAKKVADVLGIEYHVVDMRDTFKEKVIDYFADEYLRGATPNPCVQCNREIKFGKMLEFAHSIGAGRVATGHYARTENRDGRTLLLRSDSSKDQSYFLSMLRQDQLSAAFFPILDMEKTALRDLAEVNNLPVARKKDSQEVCFIPDNDYVSYLCKYRGISPQEGDFVDTKGNVLGKHKGILCYTVGQRKGLGAFGKPMFVTHIDPISHRVILGENGEQYADGLEAEQLNWIYWDVPPASFRCEAKIRYRATPAWATVEINDDKVSVRFDEPQRSVTPGQTIVFYDGDIVLGAGRICNNL